MSRTTRTSVLLGLAAAGTAALATAAPAAAHVHADPDTTAAGGTSTVTFRVPNESDSAATTSVEVSLPTDAPLTSVLVEPVAGWTARVSEEPLPEPVERDGATLTRAPASITWTADPGTPGIGVGEFQEFRARLGPLPDEGTRVLLPTVQTYADGEVADWSQVVAEGADEPENPAPEFTTTAASGDDEHAGHGAGGTSTTDEQTAMEAAPPGGGATASSDTTARVLGGAGLLLGAAALVVVLLRRRPTRP